MILGIIAVLACIAFLVIAAGYKSEVAQQADKWAQETFGYNEFLEKFHVIGNTSTILSLTVLLCVVLIIFKKSWKSAIFALLSVGGGYGLNNLLKGVYKRPRPEIEDQLTSYSFPSGHTMGTTVFMLTLVYVLNAEFFKVRPKRWLYAVALVMIAIVALSRVAGYRHYLTDVSAAFFISVAFVILITYFYNKMKR